MPVTSLWPVATPSGGYSARSIRRARNRPLGLYASACCAANVSVMSLGSPRARNLTLVVAGTVALLLDASLHEHAGVAAPVRTVLALAACVPLLWRERAPVASLLALEVGLVTCVVVFHPYDAAMGILMVQLVTVAILGDRRRSLVVGAITAIVLVVTIALLDKTGSFLDAGALARLLLVLGAVVVGDTVRSRGALRIVRRERQLDAARESEERSRQRVINERLRIARELHDTLAHALVAINVRAGVAAHLGAAQPDTGAFSEIKDVSAQALHDLRATLDLLREGDEEAPTLPAQDLEELPRLIDRVRAAGLSAHAHVRLNGTEVPASISQTAFRIVQESLTNVLRHAHASRAEVRVGLAAGVLEIEIVDDGRGASTAAGEGPGHGLLGMSERVVALGGGVAAGPRDAGGWRVHAKLPLGSGRP